jgi:hypothetical protein
MSNDKWWENIPNRGMLIKNLDTNLRQIVPFAVITKAVIDDDTDISHARPATAEEWWQFAPWQPIETVPLRQKVLMLCSDDRIRLLYFDKKWLANYLPEIKPIKWLPLPKFEG